MNNTMHDENLRNSEPASPSVGTVASNLESMNEAIGRMENLERRLEVFAEKIGYQAPPSEPQCKEPELSPCLLNLTGSQQAQIHKIASSMDNIIGAMDNILGGG